MARWLLERRVVNCILGTMLLVLSLPVTTLVAGEGVGNSVSRQSMSPQEFKQRLVGPITVIATPFDSQRNVDHDGVRTMVDRARRHGCRVFALTAGDSRYTTLTDDEIYALTETLVGAAKGEVLTIAAASWWSKEKVIDYARHAESLGASAVQVLLPKDISEAEQVEYYRDIAHSTKLGIVLHGNFSESLLHRLVEIDSIVALKEDIGLPYYINRQVVFGNHLAIFSGGSEGRYLVGYPYGSPAYYSVFYQFAPELGSEFWTLIQMGRVKEAGDFVKKYDHPYMQGWSHGRWHASLEYFGVAPRYLRPPDKTFDSAEMAELKKLFDRMALKPRSRADK